MWLQLPKIGIVPTQQEIDDYIALFRYLAYLLATPPEYFETSEKAKAVMESLYFHELELSDTSKVLGHNFVKCLEDLPPMNISKEFIEAGSRWFNGDDFCDALDLGKPGWYHYVLMMGLIWAVMALAYLQRFIPPLDKFMINVTSPFIFAHVHGSLIYAFHTQYFRDLLYRVIILSESGLGKPSVFNFKYVPQLGKKTEKEDMSSPQKDCSSARLNRPAERVLFSIAVVGCGAIFAVIASGVKIGTSMWRIEL